MYESLEYNEICSGHLYQACGKKRFPNSIQYLARLHAIADSEDGLFQLMTEIHGAYILSLDAAISDESGAGETTLGEITSDATSPSPEDWASRRETEQRLAKTLEGLSTSERQVITLYYYDELTLREIGEVLGLSESRVCQIHRAVIRKLKQHLRLRSEDAIC